MDPADYNSSLMITVREVTQLDLLGFNLWRAESVGGSRQLINPQLIPSLSPGELHGNNYQYLDTAVEDRKAYYYWIEWVGKNGSEYYGPVSASLLRFKILLPLSMR